MNAEIQNALMGFLVNLVIALVGLTGAYATYYLQKASKKLAIETEKITEDRKRDLLQVALWRLEEVALKTVTKIEETTAKSIRKAVVIGQKDKAELEKLAIKAYEEIVNTLEPEYTRVIQSSLGDAQTYIMNTIEEKVRLVKTGESVGQHGQVQISHITSSDEKGFRYGD